VIRRRRYRRLIHRLWLCVHYVSYYILQFLPQNIFFHRTYGIYDSRLGICVCQSVVYVSRTYNCCPNTDNNPITLQCVFLTITEIIRLRQRAQLLNVRMNIINILVLFHARVEKIPLFVCLVDFTDDFVELSNQQIDRLFFVVSELKCVVQLK